MVSILNWMMALMVAAFLSACSTESASSSVAGVDGSDISPDDVAVDDTSDALDPFAAQRYGGESHQCILSS